MAVTASVDPTVLVPVDKRTSLQSLQDFAGGLQSVVITSDAEEAGAWDTIKKIRADIKQAEADRTEITREWYEKKTAVDAFYKKAIDAVRSVDAKIGAAIQQYTTKKRLAAEAKQREIQAKIDAERRAAEAKAQLEREKAEILAAAGKQKKAEAALARAENAEAKAAVQVAPIIEPTKVQGAGSMVDKWEARIVDKDAAVKACIADRTLSPAVVLDTKVLEKVYSALKGDLKIPGVEFINNPVLRSARG